MVQTAKGVKDLFKEVIEEGLCTGCGACLTGCPYITKHEGRLVMMDQCTCNEGDCYKHCPRTFWDINGVRKAVFGDSYTDSEIGNFSEVCMARSANSEIKKKAQDGGTVSSLLVTAIEEGLVNVVAGTKMNETKEPSGYLARCKKELLQCAGSSYETSFALEAYRNIPKDGLEKVAIVGMGCQIEAVGKMKQTPPQNSINPQNIKLSVGLICGWSLSYKSFHPYLEKNYDLSKVCKFDIPHTPHDSFDLKFKNESNNVSIPLDDVKPFINPGCHYCWDMTAEFSDISVGSAGSQFPGWNTVIIRSPKGAEIVALAKEKGVIETKALPDHRLANLKKAALKRKMTAFKNIVGKSGNNNDLLYMGGLPKSVTDKYLNQK
jgi:coenzyme F420 hydrogenase subunit beta